MCGYMMKHDNGNDRVTLYADGPAYHIRVSLNYANAIGDVLGVSCNTYESWQSTPSLKRAKRLFSRIKYAIRKCSNIERVKELCTEFEQKENSL